VTERTGWGAGDGGAGVMGAPEVGADRLSRCPLIGPAVKP
jgi:hypothetical protein